MQPASDLKTWYRMHASGIVGLDEAGRGPLAGPVVAAAVVLDSGRRLIGLNDSKKLSESKRELLFDKIKKSARAFGISVMSSQDIDSINILRASLLAMKNAAEEVQTKLGETLVGALVDGNQRAPLPRSILQFTVVDGDAIWPVIMAASILAKVTRDRLMLEYDALYPGYGFAEHKGYGTPPHLEALKRLGPSPIHRLSFAPVKGPDDSQRSFAFFEEAARGQQTG